MLYFAYGSNLDAAQMKSRCPDMQVIGIARLEDHALCFPRLSELRGCGVCSIEPRKGERIWGVVYRLSQADLASLDTCEGFVPGLPPHENHYNRHPVSVVLEGAPTRVDTYIANRQDNPPPPSAAYLRHMREGARHHGLPADYVRFLDELYPETGSV